MLNRKCVSANFHLFQWGQFLRVSPLISFSVNFIVSHNITFHGKPINPTHNSTQFLGISITPKTKHAQAGLQALVQALWQRCTQWPIWRWFLKTKNTQILPCCILLTPCNWRQQWVCPPLLHLHLFHPLARVNCNHPHSHTLSLIFPFLLLFLHKYPAGSTTANPVNPHGIDNILNRFPLELPKLFLWDQNKTKLIKIVTRSRSLTLPTTSASMAENLSSMR